MDTMLLSLSFFSLFKISSIKARWGFRRTSNLSNVPELLDYRVNIHIHDNIITRNAIVAIRK